MSEFVIHCPECNKGLKVRDSSKLGKKAGCPKCGHVFVLSLPKNSSDDSEEEIEFELADKSQAPLVGTAGRWIPDKKSAAPVPAPVSQSDSEDDSAAEPGEMAQPEIDLAPSALASRMGKKKAPKPVAASPLRKKKPRNNKTTIISAVATVAIIGGGFLLALNLGGDAPPAKGKPGKDAVVAVAENVTEVIDDTDDSDAPETPDEEPISLWGLPMGARVLISLRPAELWEKGSRSEEVRFCLGPLATWAESQIKQRTKRDPAQVEHVLFALIPGEVGKAPTVSLVVTYGMEITPSQYINDFGGVEEKSYGYPVAVNGDIAYVRHPKEKRTVAICPTHLAKEVVDGVQGASSQSVGIDALIAKTNQNSHLSLIFEPRSVRRHQEAMFPVETQNLVTHLVDWFNDEEIETVAWGLHFGKEKFDSHIVLRNQTGFSESRLDKDMQQKMKLLPERLWHELADKMDPPVAGPRKIIGRFPAMMQVFAKNTKGGRGNRFTVLDTSLKERAAPNIALASLLSWDESTRTDFSKAAPSKTTGSEEKLPELVADRLKRKIECEFPRTPLQDAIKYIADECKVGHDIDGDALKDKGYTKNMPQIFTLNDTGFAALKEIMKKYPDMVIVIDEPQKQFILTTRGFAEKKKQTVFEIK